MDPKLAIHCFVAYVHNVAILAISQYPSLPFETSSSLNLSRIVADLGDPHSRGFLLRVSLLILDWDPAPSGLDPRLHPNVTYLLVYCTPTALWLPVPSLSPLMILSIVLPAMGNSPPDILWIVGWRPIPFMAYLCNVAIFCYLAVPSPKPCSGLQPALSRTQHPSQLGLCGAAPYAIVPFGPSVDLHWRSPAFVCSRSIWPFWPPGNSRPSTRPLNSPPINCISYTTYCWLTPMPFWLAIHPRKISFLI